MNLLASNKPYINPGLGGNDTKAKHLNTRPTQRGKGLNLTRFAKSAVIIALFLADSAATALAAATTNGKSNCVRYTRQPYCTLDLGNYKPIPIFHANNDDNGAKWVDCEKDVITKGYE